MSKLISGKEAYRLIGDGVEIEARVELKENLWRWEDAKHLPACDILSDGFDFRLKPQTIALNGIEVPACGADYKPHTFMFVLNSLEPCEYSKIILDDSDEVPPYWWRTEEEIKQVVAALRCVFGGES